MSTTENTIWIESAWEDFFTFLERKDFKNARALQDSVGENGFESDALSMHKKINSAIAGEDFSWEPYSHPTPPTIKPSEMDEVKPNYSKGCPSYCNDPSHD